MSELRHDPLTGRRVLIAENRAGRPNEFASKSSEEPLADDSPRADCPFCPGNEERTPDATLELFNAEGEWQVRAFPNKYPAVDAASGQGVHEVIVESRRHIERTGRLTLGELTRVLFAYAERMRAVADEGRLPYRLLFKNVGASAGASIHHLHSQFVALPEVPAQVAAEQQRLAARHASDGVHAWSEWIEAERASRERVHFDDGEWLVVCPPASRQPGETWIMPVGHHPHYERQINSLATAEGLAAVLLPIVRAIEAEIGDAGYNLMIHTTPDGVPRDAGHWRMEIVPRVSSLAGLELATGLFLNTLSPERAAARLRERLAEGAA